MCTSVNDVVCHGIPSDSVVLSDGDIVNIDVTTNLDGWHGDTDGAEARQALDHARQRLAAQAEVAALRQR